MDNMDMNNPCNRIICQDSGLYICDHKSSGEYQRLQYARFETFMF